MSFPGYLNLYLSLLCLERDVLPECVISWVSELVFEFVCLERVVLPACVISWVSELVFEFVVPRKGCAS